MFLWKRVRSLHLFFLESPRRREKRETQLRWKGHVILHVSSFALYVPDVTFANSQNRGSKVYPTLKVFYLENCQWVVSHVSILSTLASAHRGRKTIALFRKTRRKDGSTLWPTRARQTPSSCRAARPPKVGLEYVDQRSKPFWGGENAAHHKYAQGRNPPSQTT